jgi:hypothetical protein
LRSTRTSGCAGTRTTWRRSTSGIRAGSGRILLLSSISRSAGITRVVLRYPPIGLLGPRIEAVLEIEMVREHASRLEVRTHEPVRALQSSLRLRLQLRLMVLLGSEPFV